MKALSSIVALLFLTCFGYGQSSMESECIQSLKRASPNLKIERQPRPSSVKGDTVVFERTQVVLRNSSPLAFRIFRNGLLSPSLIMAASTNGDGSINKSHLSSIGSVTISSFIENKIPGEAPTSRTFTFLRWTEGMANPKMYILQLTNKNATAATSTADFIEDSDVSVFGFCSILM